MATRGLPWCKLYAEARLDKKLAQLTLAERGVWTNLLCYASEQSERGTFDATDRFDLAVECADGDEEVLGSTLDKLLRVRHLVPVATHPGFLSFRTFEARQARKESDKPENTRERQRKSRVTRGLSRPVTRDNAKKRNVTRLEKEREREDSRYPEIPDNGKMISPPLPDSADATPAGGENMHLADTMEPLAAPTPRHVALNGHKPDGASAAEQGTPPPPSAAPPPAPIPIHRGKTKTRDPIWDTFVELFEFEPETKDERSGWGKLVRDLKAVGATPEEMRRRFRNHGWGVQADVIHWTLTPFALVKHWGELSRVPSVPQAPRQRGSPPARAAPAEPRPMPISRGVDLNAKPAPLVPSESRSESVVR